MSIERSSDPQPRRVFAGAWTWFWVKRGWIELAGAAAFSIIHLWFPLHYDQATPAYLTHIYDYAYLAMWGILGFFTAMFAKRLLSIASDIEDHLAVQNKQIKAYLTQLEGAVSQAFYLGFYSLAGGEGVKSGFKVLDERLSNSNLRGSIRELVFGFMARSVEHVGHSGLAMVNANVSHYVDFLGKMFAIRNQKIRATCVVRPYWFVYPEIPKISLPLLEKAGHLIPFQNYTPRPLRIAVYDERTIAEILLTGFIDRELSTLESASCPNCRSLKGGCPLHLGRTGHAENQIPEIYWFEKYVNRSGQNCVDLKYTHISESDRSILSILEDRVFLQSADNLMDLDVRFEFTNLSSGTLWLRWGDRAQKFDPYDSWFAPDVFKLTYKHSELDTPEDLRLYEKFWTEDLNANCLLDSSVDKTTMVDYLLNILKRDISAAYGDKGKRDKLPKMPTEALQKMLGDDTINIIITSIDKLIAEINSSSTLRDIYQSLVDHYKAKGTTEVAYVVSHDKNHPGVPVAVVRWKENWDIICKSSK